IRKQYIRKGFSRNTFMHRIILSVFFLIGNLFLVTAAASLDTSWHTTLEKRCVSQPAEVGIELDSLFEFVKDKPSDRFHWDLLRSRVFITLGKYDTALTICFDGLNRLPPSETLKQAYYHKQIGVVYYYLRQKEKAIEAFKDVLRLARNSEFDTILVSTVRSNMGAIYIELEKPEEAERELMASIDLARAYYGSREHEAEPTFPYRLLGTLYETQGNYDKALPYLSSALQLSYATQDTIQIIGALLFYGDALFNSNQLGQAFEQYDKARVLANNSDSPDTRMETFIHLKNAYRRTGNFEEGLNFSDSLLSLQISVYQKDLATRISEMETRFETDKLRQENLTKQADLEAAHARARTRNVIIISLVLIALALVVIGLNLLKQQQLKKQKVEQESVIKLQNERLRISRDLHDNIGAQMTYIISSLDKLEWLQKNGKPGDAKSVSNLGEFARETMGQLRDTVWAMKQETLTIADLLSRLRIYCSKIEELTSLRIEFLDLQNSPSGKLETAMALDIYRIVQEALQNALKHSEATMVTVGFKLDKTHWNISVSDNGKGFERNNSQAGNGLLNMEYRCTEKGIGLVIKSIPGSGTTIELSIPLKNVISPPGRSHDKGTDQK
ncbi:MAG: tetratricopeptide repeat-containing sensor histidine kinase, partial [Owenweeksia sp.]